MTLFKKFLHHLGHVLLFIGSLPAKLLRAVSPGAYEQLEKMASFAVPPRVHLVEVQKLGYVDEAKHSEAVATLQSRGFEDAGQFRVMPLDVPMHLFVDRGNQIKAGIYETPLTGVAVELITRFKDGSSYSSINRKNANVKFSDVNESVYLGPVSVEELLERHQVDRPAKPRIAVSRVSAPRFEELGYEVGIRVKRGEAVTREEMARRFTELENESGTMRFGV